MYAVPMEHDPLGDSDDALLRFIEGRQLCLDGVVGVCHLGLGARAAGRAMRPARVHSYVLQLAQCRRDGVVGRRATAWSGGFAAPEATSYSSPASQMAGRRNCSAPFGRQDCASRALAVRSPVRPGQLGAPLHVQPDDLNTTTANRQHAPDAAIFHLSDLLPLHAHCRHGRQVSVAG